MCISCSFLIAFENKCILKSNVKINESCLKTNRVKMDVSHIKESHVEMNYSFGGGNHVIMIMSIMLIKKIHMKMDESCKIK